MWVCEMRFSIAHPLCSVGHWSMHGLPLVLDPITCLNNPGVPQLKYVYADQMSIHTCKIVMIIFVMLRLLH